MESRVVLLTFVQYCLLDRLQAYFLGPRTLNVILTHSVLHFKGPDVWEIVLFSVLGKVRVTLYAEGVSIDQIFSAMLEISRFIYLCLLINSHSFSRFTERK